ncbi:MAG: TerB family tellurite resistance protein [Deltaproteobacteria bacterium]|nr:TerB family tellurite resistance protein [Deltaproteobacteria bacterium]MBW2151934.1 TerB family tellurite resistance protein [Deltaproteobacteria bacterium]
MGWMGKVIGGAIGFALAGPLGAVAGAVFGHAFDREESLEEERHLTSGETAQLTFFVAAFSMLAKLVRADGRIEKEEIDTIERFMAEDLNLDPESRRYARNIFQTALKSQESFEDFAFQFYNQFRYQPQFLELMIDILFRVAVSDAALSENEERIIRSAADIFHISEERYQTFRSKYVSDVEKYYAVLNSKITDSDEHIKQQYRKLVQDYHPDKIVSKGLPEEFVKFAHQKFREIQEAYDAIKRQRGMK